jgi:hypothetical protein
MKWQRWTEDRINFLKNNYTNSSWEFLIENLNIEKSAILHKASEFGLTREYDYSNEEIEFIKNNFKKMPYKEIAEILNTTEAAIGTKINKLGLSKTEIWSEEELKLLKEVYPNYTNKYLKIKYFPNRTPETIMSMANKMGIHKSLEKETKYYNKETMIGQLLELSKILERTPLGEELFENGLPSSATYKRYFGSYFNACKLAGLPTNSNLFGKSIHCKSLNDDLCLSKSEKIITDFFILNNISYKKDQKYNIYMKDIRCKNKTVDWIINNNIFVEYFGLSDKPIYNKRMEEKRTICRDCNIVLIGLERKDLNKLHIIFKDFIN